MKLVFEYKDDTFSLIEDEKAECGYSVVCTSGNPSKESRQSLARFQELATILAGECSSPSEPDIWANMHGYLSKDDGIRILEYEWYPEGVVF